MAMTTDVNVYYEEGCGRCDLFSTPQCKVKQWTQELEQLRRIVNECELGEESKWGMPCYTHNGNNVLMVSAFKQYVSLSFFKGVLLQDAEKLLVKQGENSQSARLFKFTNVKDILALETTIKAYIYEAMEVERQGLKVEFKQKDELEYPEELVQMLAQDQELNDAFEALTPGRKRGYIIHFTQPKQSKTRTSRIEKCIPEIMEGKGVFDR